MQLYSEKRSIMNKLIGLLTCLCFSTNLAVAQNKDTSSIIKFGLFADTQYADCPSQNTRYYREALQKLDTCIEYFNRQEVQFTINFIIFSFQTVEINTQQSVFYLIQFYSCF